MRLGSCPKEGLESRGGETGELGCLARLRSGKMESSK